MAFFKKGIGDFDLQQGHIRKPKGAILKNTGIVVGIMAAATLISFAFRALGFHESNFILAYILGVLIVANLTDGYLYGVIASVLGVLVFNYFFTVPYYTLVAYSPDYPVTFIVMLVVAVITSTLTARVKRESQRAEMREKRLRVLYQNERNLLAANSMQQAVETTAGDIARLFERPVLVCAADINKELTIRYTAGEDVFDSDKERTACMEAFQSGSACGRGTLLFSDSLAYYQPIHGQSGVLGIIGIAFEKNLPLTDGQKVLLDALSTQAALALERERIYEKQQRAKTEIERERLRGDLLRSVSHDLRTPLAGILGSASTVLDNYDVLGDDVRKDFLHGIYEDAEWLNHLVDNILSMTHFSEGKIVLKKETEVVEELIASAVSRIKKQTGGSEISVDIPKEMIMIEADGTLIQQVLVNLIDNAVKHTPVGSKIRVSAAKEKDYVIFEVCDNGPGIQEKDLPLIFNRFYTSEKAGRGRRGIGLGLSICKAIVETHGGQITAQNDPSGGAVFRFTLPAKEADDETADTHSGR